MVRPRWSLRRRPSRGGFCAWTSPTRRRWLRRCREVMELVQELKGGCWLLPGLVLVGGCSVCSSGSSRRRRREGAGLGGAWGVPLAYARSSFFAPLSGWHLLKLFKAALSATELLQAMAWSSEARFGDGGGQWCAGSCSGLGGLPEPSRVCVRGVYPVLWYE